MELEQLKLAVKKIIAENAEKILQQDDKVALENLRVSLFGKNGDITAMMKILSKLDSVNRSEAGRCLNEAKSMLQQKMLQRKEDLIALELNKKLAQEKIDITLPSRNINYGSKHPLTITCERIYDIFHKIGFNLADGAEIETEYYNFDALNTPLNHPARNLQDTFYLNVENLLLRSHTSPVQIHIMENEAVKLPLRMISMGKVYRCDYDVTHTPMFHQLEGLLVDDKTTFADLKNLLTYFLQEFFNTSKITSRLRPSYFPFTEPSAEVDMSCIYCNQKGCNICKQSGWIEILGCGMVHPSVLKNVNLDIEIYTGLAFGCGLERLSMLLFEIDDIRLNFDNNIDFLAQFA